MKMKNVSEGKPIENPEGIVRRTLAYNDEAMLCRFAMAKDAAIPLHSHRAAQIGYVIDGRVKFIAEKEEDAFEVGTGDSYVFGPHVKHGAVVLEDCQIVEIFAPARDEYKDF